VDPRREKRLEPQLSQPIITCSLPRSLASHTSPTTTTSHQPGPDPILRRPSQIQKKSSAAALLCACQTASRGVGVYQFLCVQAPDQATQQTSAGVGQLRSSLTPPAATTAGTPRRAGRCKISVAHPSTTISSNSLSSHDPPSTPYGLRFLKQCTRVRVESLRSDCSTPLT
jgi:hypothetical protein